MKIPANHGARSAIKLLDNLPRVDADQKITIALLQHHGFTKDKEAGELLGLLGFLGFVSNGFPDSLWHEYVKTADNKPLLRRAIKESYAPLFHGYPNAHREPKITIMKWMQATYDYKTTTSERAERMFRYLCEFADFKDVDTDQPDGHPQPVATEQSASPGPQLIINLSPDLITDPAFHSLLKRYIR